LDARLTFTSGLEDENTTEDINPIAHTTKLLWIEIDHVGPPSDKVKRAAIAAFLGDSSPIHRRVIECGENATILRVWQYPAAAGCGQIPHRCPAIWQRHLGSPRRR
jgi:hypothetical protein